MRNAISVISEHERLLNAEALTAYLEVLSAKGATIRKAKAAHFKQVEANAAKGRRVI